VQAVRAWVLKGLAEERKEAAGVDSVVVVVAVDKELYMITNKNHLRRKRI
jgi:hypothetical protein